MIKSFCTSNLLRNALVVGGVLFYLLILIALFGRAFSQNSLIAPPTILYQLPSNVHRPPSTAYKITWGKAAGWLTLAVAGFVDGAVEGYEFDGRQAFVRKWNADPNGFWGPDSWRLAYRNGNPDDGYRNLFTRFYGSPDFYHVGDDVRKAGYIGGAVTLGISGAKQNRKWWHYALDIGIGLAVSSVTKRAGMAWVRN